ncbi:MAG: hypothetical protein WCE62_02245 [Polyangiales bacterium]
MPSPEHAADLERVLARAAQECALRAEIWFGTGLPQALRSAIQAQGKSRDQGPAQLAFVEVRAVSPQGCAISDGDLSGLRCPVIGLSAATLGDLASLVGPQSESGIQITRLICPVAVFDFSADGVRVREVRHGLTAADLQRRLSVPLWSGPDLRELGSH